MAKFTVFDTLELTSQVTNYAFYHRFKPDTKLNCHAFNQYFDEELARLLKSPFKCLSTDAQITYLKAFFVTHIR